MANKKQSHPEEDTTQEIKKALETLESIKVDVDNVSRKIFDIAGPWGLHYISNEGKEPSEDEFLGFSQDIWKSYHILNQNKIKLNHTQRLAFDKIDYARREWLKNRYSDNNTFTSNSQYENKGKGKNKGKTYILYNEPCYNKGKGKGKEHNIIYTYSSQPHTLYGKGREDYSPKYVDISSAQNSFVKGKYTQEHTTPLFTYNAKNFW